MTRNKLLIGLCALPFLFGFGSTPNSTVAANGGTQVTLTGTSAVILKGREARNYGKIWALTANAVNASCVLQTVRGTDPTAVATNIVLVPGAVLDLCSGSTCFGGSVSCIAVSGSPVVVGIDF